MYFCCELTGTFWLAVNQITKTPVRCHQRERRNRIKYNCRIRTIQITITCPHHLCLFGSQYEGSIPFHHPSDLYICNHTSHLRWKASIVPCVVANMRSYAHCILTFDIVSSTEGEFSLFHMLVNVSLAAIRICITIGLDFGENVSRVRPKRARCGVASTFSPVIWEMTLKIFCQ